MDEAGTWLGGNVLRGDEGVVCEGEGVLVCAVDEILAGDSRAFRIRIP